jgi:hypothetical protein
MAHQICVLTAFSEHRLRQSSRVVAPVNCLELPADGHFAWDVRWQGLKSLLENSQSRDQCGKIRERASEAGAKARHILNRLRPD